VVQNYDGVITREAVVTGHIKGVNGGIASGAIVIGHVDDRAIIMGHVDDRHGHSIVCYLCQDVQLVAMVGWVNCSIDECKCWGAIQTWGTCLQSEAVFWPQHVPQLQQLLSQAWEQLSTDGKTDVCQW